jgi:hypothetical protein
MTDWEAKLSASIGRELAYNVGALTDHYVRCDMSPETLAAGTNVWRSCARVDEHDRAGMAYADHLDKTRAVRRLNE